MSETRYWESSASSPPFPPSPLSSPSSSTSSSTRVFFTQKYPSPTGRYTLQWNGLGFITRYISSTYISLYRCHQHLFQHFHHQTSISLSPNMGIWAILAILAILARYLHYHKWQQHNYQLCHCYHHHIMILMITIFRDTSRTFLWQWIYYSSNIPAEKTYHWR